jgi:hypothetical protein
MPYAQPLTLDIHCAACGGAVTVQFIGWETYGAEPDVAQTWKCPLCEKTNRGTFPWRLAWVVKRTAQTERMQ